MKKILFWITTYSVLIIIGLILIKPLIYQEEVCGIIKDKMQPSYYNSSFILRNRIVMSIKNSIVIKCDDNSIETVNNVDDEIYYSKEINDNICLKRVNGSKNLIYIGIFSLLTVLVITLFFIISLILTLYNNHIS